MADRGAPEGNDNASRGKEFRAALQRVLARRSGGAGWRISLEKVIEKLVDCAEAGEQWAIQEIANRIDGKPAQSLIVAGDEDGAPLKFQRIERVIVKPKD